MCKQLLLRQLREAYADMPDMSLKSALANLSEDEANYTPAVGIKTIKQLVIHIADIKVLYCSQAFSTADIQISGPDFASAMKYLEAAHAQLTACLERCREEDLVKPLPTRKHGDSAAYFFCFMAMHDLWHGGQIRTRLALYASEKAKAMALSR